MIKLEQEVVTGDTWKKGSAVAKIKGYTKDNGGFVIYIFGDFIDYRVATERDFRKDFIFSYADTHRKESNREKFKRIWNNILRRLYIK